MELTDAELVAAGKRRDAAAYNQLVRRHLRRVFAICLGVLGEIADAEDVAQEVFLEGYRKLSQLRDDDRFAAWIGQIARNRCRDDLRRRRRRLEQPLPPELAMTPATSDDGFADLREALSRMPEEHRLPLLLFYYDGKDTRTLARDLGLTQGGVCARLFRARRHLRDLLAEEEVRHE